MARTDNSLDSLFSTSGGTGDKLEIVLESTGGPITIPHANLLFKADFERDGPDLLLVNDGQPTVRLIDYFTTSNPPALQSPEGNTIEGRIVEILAGPVFPGQVAQGAPGLAGAAGADAIGQVESVSGTASVQRADGTVVPLTVTAKVFQNDVVSTGDGGALSITFTDGTIFTLAANSRMVLDELIYNPAGSDNSGVFNLIEGSFVFIAGQVAKTGGMEVKTPAATMGIRGTTVKIDIVTVEGNTTVEVSLNEDPDGTTGQFTITRLDGTVIADVVATETKWIISPVQGETREVPRSLDDLNADQIILTQAFSAFESANVRVQSGGEFVEQDSSGGQPGEGNDGENTDPNAPDPDAPDQRGDLGSSGLGTEVASDTLDSATSTLGTAEISELGGEGFDALGASGPTTGGVDGEGENREGNEETVLETEDEETVPDDESTLENTSPVITLSAGSFTVPEDGSVVLSGFDISDNTSILLTATLVAGSTVTLPGGSGVTILEGTGTDDERLVIQGTAEQITNALNGLIYAPSPNADQQGTLSIEVTDGTLNASTLLVITILAEPDNPIALPDTADQGEDGGLLIGSLLTNDSDPDVTPVADVLTVIAVTQGENSVSVPADGFATLTLSGGGTLVVLSDGTYSFSQGTAYKGLSDGETFTETVTYTLSDNTVDENGNPRTSSSTISITIEGTSDGPVVSGDGETIGEDGTSFAITTDDLTALDPDTADASLVYTITIAPVEGILALASAPGVAISTFTQADLAAGDVIYEHGSSTGTSDSFSFIVSDGARIASGSLTVTAVDINDDPSATGFETSLDIDEDQATPLDLSSVVLADDDAGIGNLTVTLQAGSGSVSAAGVGTGLTVTQVSADTLTIEGALADLNGFFSGGGVIIYTPPQDAVGTPVDTLNVFVNDNGNTGAGGGTEILVAAIPVNTSAINDAPVVSITGDTTADFVENDTSVTLDGTVAITDVDNATLTQATLSFTSGYETGDTLALPASPGFTAVFDPGSRTLTISGTGTPAQYEALIGSVTFTNPSENPSTAQRVIAVAVSDGTDTSTIQNMLVNVEAVNDAPTVSGVPTSFSVTEDASSEALSLSSLSIDDVDGDEFGDTIQLTISVDIGTIDPPASSSSATVIDAQTIRFEGTRYDLSAEFASGDITYTPPANFNGVATASIIIDDLGSTGTGGAQTVNASIPINVTPVDDASVLTDTSTAASFTEDGAPEIVADALSIADLDSTTLTSATVAITIGRESPNDELLFTNTANITGSFSSATGVLTLTGTATLAQYEAALESITFNNSDDALSTDARTVDITVFDGGTASNTITRTVDVVTVNDAPTLSGVPGFFTATEDTPTSFDLTNLVVGDPDAGSSDLTVRLTTNNSTFAPVADTTITIDATDPTAVTFTGSATNLNAYFAANGNIPFTPDPDFNGSVTITTRVIDNGNTGDTGGILFNEFSNTFNVTAVDDAPTLGGTGLSGAIFTENGAATSFIDTVNIADVDDANITGATLSIILNLDPSNDTLNFTDTATITGNYDATNGVLTLSGTDTLAAYEAALLSVTYSNASDDPLAGQRTIRTQVSNGLDSGTFDATLTVNAINDAPVVSITGDTTADFVENDTSVTLDGTVAITDVDNATLTQATLSFTGGYETGDTLALPASPGFTAVFDTGSRTLTISGTGTPAQYEALIGSVTFSNPSENPSTAQRVIAVAVSDGTDTSTIQNMLVNVEAVNDAPTVSGVPTSFNVTEDASGEALSLSSLSIDDVDGDEFGDTIQLTISVDIGTIDPPASSSSATVIDAQTIRFEGTRYDLSTEFASGDITYTPPANFNGVATASIIIDDLGSTGTGGAQTVNASIPINVTPVDDASVLTDTSTAASFTEDGAPEIVADALSIADLDSTTLTSATVAITIGRESPNDELLFTNTANITGSFNSATGVLTLTGTATLAQYEAALQSITFNNSDDALSTNARTVDITVFDGGTASNTITRTVDVVTVNDAPTLSGVPGFFTATEDTPTSFDLTNLVVGDPDAGSSDLTVRLTTNNSTFAPVADTTITIDATDPTAVTFTGSATNLNAYFAANGNIPFTPDPDFNGSVTITTRVIDNGNTGDTGGILFNEFSNTFNVAPVDDAPTVTTAPSAASYTEGGAPASITSNATIADIDDTQLTGATVSITSGFNPGDVFAFSNINNITGNYSFSSGVLVFSGTDTLANYELALESVSLLNTSDTPGNANRVIEIQVSNGANSNTETRTVAVSDVNDAPSVTFDTNPLLDVVEDTPTAIIPVNFDLTDVDAGGADVDLEVTSDDGALAFNNLTGSGLTLVGETLTGSIADLETYVLGGNIVLTPLANAAGNDRVFFAINDGGNSGAGGALSDGRSIGINLVPVNDAPVMTTTVGNASFLEGDAPVAVDASLTLVDVDNSTLSGATVSIGSGFATGDDFLRFTDQSGITGSYNATSGILTLTGSASVAAYQAALRTVAFENTSSTPTTDNRVISFTASDNDDTSIAVTRAVEVSDASNAPVIDTGNITGGTNLVANGSFESGPATLSDGGILIPAGTGTLANWTVAAGSVDQISQSWVAEDGSFSIDLNGNSAGTLTQTIATTPGQTYELTFYMARNPAGDNTESLNLDIGGVNFPFSFTNGASTTTNMAWEERSAFFTATGSSTAITFSSPDAGSSGPAIDGVAVRQTVASVVVDEDQSVFINNIIITDLDADGPMVVTLSVTSGVLTVTDSFIGGLSAAEITGNGTATVTLTGPLAEINATLGAFEGVLFTPTANFAGNDTLTITANDQGDGGAAPLSDTQTVSIQVDPVNDGPTLTALGTRTAVEETPTVIDLSALELNDVDAGTNDVQMDITATGGTVALASGSTSDVTVSTISGGFRLIGAVADIETFLTVANQLTFTGDTDLAGTGAGSIDLTLNDLGNTGTGGPISGTSNIVVDITDVNDAPVLANVTGTNAFQEGDGVTILNAALDLSDLDSANLQTATVSISANHVAGEDFLSANTTGTALAANYQSSTGILTISGTGTVADYQQVLRSVAYNNVSENPDTSPRTISFSASDGIDTSNVLSRTVNITAVNDAPTISALGDLTLNEDQTFALNLSSIALEDVDAGTADVAMDITTGGGTITIASTSTALVTVNPTPGGIRLVGSVEDIEDFMQVPGQVSYTPAPNATGTFIDAITFTLLDSGSTGNGGGMTDIETINISVNAVNDAPTIAAPATVSVFEDTPTGIDLSTLDLSDLDAGAAVATLNLTATGGTISLSSGSTASVTVTAITGGFELTGAIEDIEDFLQVSAQVIYRGASDLNGTGAGSIDLSLNDLGNTGAGGSQTTVESIVVDITALDDPSVITAGPGGASFTESSGSFEVVDPNLTITDVDSTNLSRATVKLTTNYVQSQDNIGVSNILLTSLGLSQSFQQSNGTLTLTITGTATVAEYQQALQAVSYNNNSQNPNGLDRTLEYTVFDGTTASNVATQTVGLIPTNDAPLALFPTSQTISEDTPTAIDLSSSSLFFQVDENGAAVTATVTATGGVFQDGAGTSSSLTFTGSIANINSQLTAPGAVTFIPDANLNGTGAAAVTFTVDDGGSTGLGGAQTASDTISINITPVDDLPVVSTPSAAAMHDEGAVPTIIDAGLTITDIDSTTITGATVKFTTNFDIVGDRFVFGSGLATTFGITANYTPATGTLSFTGTATLAEYQQVLRTVAYNTISDTPSSADRTVEFTVFEGANGSNVATQTVEVTPTNDAPTIGSLGAINIQEDETVFVDLSSLALDDVDSTGLDMVATITSSGGTLALASGSTALVTVATVTDGFTLTGAIEDIEDFLQVANQVSFAADSNINGNAAGGITLVLNDNGQSGAGGALSATQTLDVNIAAVNDAPTIDVTRAITTNEDTPVALSFVAAGQFLAADVDAGIQDITVTVSAGNGSLSFGSSGAVTVTPDGAGGGTITGNIGSVRSYVLSGNVTYTPDTDFSGPDNVTFTISDNGNTGSGGALTASDTLGVNVIAVNDDPTINITNVTLNTDLVSNGGFEQGPTSGQFTQVNSGSTAITDWTVGLSSVDHYHGPRQNAEGTAHLDLNGLGQGSVSQTIATVVGVTYEVTFNMSRAPIAFPPDDLRLTINGTSEDFTYTTAGGTESNMQWEERSTFFTATSTTTTLTFATLEVGNSGPAIDNVSVQATIGASDTVTADEDTTIFINNIEVADVDTAGSLTVALVVTNGSLQLNETAAGGLTAGSISGNGSAAVTFTGTAAQINATLGSFEGLSFTASPDFFGTTTLAIAVNDGAGGITNETITIDVANTPDAPLPTSSLTAATAGTGVNIDAIEFIDPNASNLGTSVSNIGDINGDGFDDFAIGNPDGTTQGGITGSTSIILGAAGANPYRALADTDGEVLTSAITTTTGGFEFVGGGGDRNGFAVTGAGDVNGDGISDFVLSEVFANLGGIVNVGSAYVVFGGQNFNAQTNAAGEISTGVIGFTGGLEGFAFQGSDTNQNVGYSISIAGDVNFDGIDDILIGAPTAIGARGNAYLVYGGQDFATLAGADGTISLIVNRLPGAVLGAQFLGENVPDLAGFDVSIIGDVSGDGIDDFAIASLQNSNSGAASTLGAVHVIYGGQDFSVSGLGGGVSGKEVGLTDVGGAVQGFQINGTTAGQGVGLSLAGKIDFNNDGIQDVIFADQAVSTRVFVLYGGQTITGTITTADIEAGTYNGAYFTPPGSTRQTDVANGGDINGDGIDDLIIGAKFVDAPGSNSGETFVIYGGQNLTGQVTFDTIGTTTEGFSLTGETAGDFSGTAVNAAGDVNQDGYDDFLIGAPGSLDSTPGSGAAYLVYGGDFNGALTGQTLGTSGNDTLTGTSGADVLLGLGGTDFITTNGGADNVDAGAGNDIVYVSDALFTQIDGGAGDDGITFIDGGNIDLTGVANGRISSIESLSITTAGATSIRLGLDDVFALSDTGSTNIKSNLNGVSPTEALTNSLQVFADTSDTIFLENNSTGGWVLNAAKSPLLTGQDVVEFIASGSGDVLATLAVSDDATLTIVP